jgi:hypothetical protein
MDGMKRTSVLSTAALASILLAAPASAATCDFSSATGIVFAPDYSAVTILFDDFTAGVGDAASCSATTFATDPFQIDLTNGGANPIPAGTVIAYGADYRGSLDPNSSASIQVVTVGLTSQGTVVANDANPPPNNVSFSNIVGTNTTVLTSDIQLAMLSADDPLNKFTLETIDYTELGRTTIADIQTSVDQFAANHTSLVTHLNATADLLTGAGQKLEQGNGVTALGGVGSFTLGATGRRALDGGFTLLGGAAVFNQSAGGATGTGLLVSGSLRYITPGDGLVRPYGEVGLISAPAMGLSFTRSYVTSTGTTTATGNATGALYGGFVKGGALFAPDADNELVFAATLAKDWLLTGAYTETLSGSNLFAASAPAQTSSFDTVKAGIDWTTRPVPKTELTLSAALGTTIAENAVATNVAFAGTFSGAPRSELFAEYGARIAYEIDPTQSIAAFVHGSTGQYSGTHVQVGGDFHVRF